MTLQVLATRTRAPVPSFGELLTRAMRTRTGRVGVLVAGCLWELGALLQQPSLTTDSYAHPTISTLTDPVLATSPGRAVVLFAWLAFGWYLVKR